MEGLLGLLAFVLTAQACFCCSSSVGQVAIPITAKESDLRFTVALVDPDSPQEILCSGTLISSTLVVTLKYCVEEKSEIVAYFGITSYPPNTNEVFARGFTQDDIQFSPFALADGTRIALLRLSDPIESGELVKPIALATHYMFSSLSAADAATLFWTLGSPQTLTSAALQIVSVQYGGGSSFIQGRSSTALRLEGVNESGAPLYIIDKRGVPRLVGIKIQLDSGYVNGGSLQSYVLIENYLDWLLVEILKDCADE